MIGVYIIGGFVILLLLAIYGAINRLTRELKAMFIAILASKKSPWEEMVERFKKDVEEENKNGSGAERNHEN
jgi:TRAP-type C4-dicarboxylate transport system substrate-binding protein